MTMTADWVPDSLQTEIPQGKERNLRGLALLHDAQPATIAELENISTWYWCPEGVQIFDRSDHHTDVFFIAEGTVRVVDHAASGQEVAFSDLEAGTVLGELSAIDGEPRSATVFAAEDTLLAKVEAAAFLDFLARHPDVGLRLMHYFVSTIRGLNSRVVGLSSMSSVQRVYGELLQMSEPDPEGDGRWKINSMPQHKEIAVWAGTTPETVARAIGELLKAEVVKRRHKTLLILDRQRLHELATAS